MKIINLGSLNIDKVYSVKNIVQEGETIDSIAYEENIGGKGLNQSISIARAGGNILHAGCVGKDGHILLDALKKSGVDISLIKTSSNISGQAIIQVDSKGQNCIILYHGANYDITKEYINTILSNCNSNDILLLQNEISNIKYAIEEAKKKNLKIFFNPSPINDTLTTYDFSLLQGIFVNEHEAAYLSGNIKNSKNIEIILNLLASKYPNLEIILTVGSQGAYYRYKNMQIFQPAYKVNAIDTTAAGDTFTGYFLALRQAGKSIKECLNLANKAASITVTRKGASISIPYINEI